MNITKYFQAGIMVLMSVFVLGLTIPAIGSENPVASTSLGKSVMKGARTMVATLAELTGKDVSEIQTERREGKPILDIAEDSGVDEQELVNAISANNQERLKARLDAGSITQEQYDSCLGSMQQNIKERLERSETGVPGPGQGCSRQNRHGGAGCKRGAVNQSWGCGSCPMLGSSSAQ